jgi:regulatory protein
LAFPRRAASVLRLSTKTDAKPTAKALAVRWLARRDLSRAELALRLRRRGVEEPEVTRTLDELAALGYLSDARYASAVVAQRKGRYGKRAIAHALAERGIRADDASKALAQLADSDETADALALWRRRFGQAPRDEREKARHVRFLQSRGYSLSVALAVLRKAGVAEADEAF